MAYDSSAVTQREVRSAPYALVTAAHSAHVPKHEIYASDAPNISILVNRYVPTDYPLPHSEGKIVNLATAFERLEDKLLGRTEQYTRTALSRREVNDILGEFRTYAAGHTINDRHVADNGQVISFVKTPQYNELPSQASGHDSFDYSDRSDRHGTQDYFADQGLSIVTLADELEFRRELRKERRAKPSL